MSRRATQEISPARECGETCNYRGSPFRDGTAFVSWMPEQQRILYTEAYFFPATSVTAAHSKRKNTPSCWISMRSSLP